MITVLLTVAVLLLLQVKVGYGLEYSASSSLNWGSSASDGMSQPCHVSDYDARVSWKDIRRLCGEGVLRIGCRLVSKGSSIYSYDLDLSRFDETPGTVSLYASTEDEIVRIGRHCDSSEHGLCWTVDNEGIREGGICGGERGDDEIVAERVIFSGDSALLLRRLQGDELPSESPSLSPSKTPSNSPSNTPSMAPSEAPSGSPSKSPSKTPSWSPSLNPSKSPSRSPSKTPSWSPSLNPSKSPSRSPSKTPSWSPSVSPSRTPSRSPSKTPSKSPTRTPSESPSRSPSQTPSGSPSLSPSKSPSKSPSRSPSRSPSKTPSKSPSRSPSKNPSKSPSRSPSESPSKSPSTAPSKSPSRSPSKTPSRSPSRTPSKSPSKSPSRTPSQSPSRTPSKSPSKSPSRTPSRSPSRTPSRSPSRSPSRTPSKSPSKTPSRSPSKTPSKSPSKSPSRTPSQSPSRTPSKSPSKSPSRTPSQSPSRTPSRSPSRSPSRTPSKSPSRSPSRSPSKTPSKSPSKSPSRSPSRSPSKTPSRSPSRTPSRSPSRTPSRSPSRSPSKTPSKSPSKSPSRTPSQSPSRTPSKSPSKSPSRTPSRSPSRTPSKSPSKSPSRTPSQSPSRTPSRSPSRSPSKTPSRSPSRTPSRSPSRSPSKSPSKSPSRTPSQSPSRTPSRSPSRSPSRTPSKSPSRTPSRSPSKTPSQSPSRTPSRTPSRSPSRTPSKSPSRSPSRTPSQSPSRTPSRSPSRSPSKTPSKSPSRTPSRSPSRSPSKTPSRSPSRTPSRSPSRSPSKTPSRSPSRSPSQTPSRSPSRTPSRSPSRTPSRTPSRSPSRTPSLSPTTSKPTTSPTTSPSNSPTVSPTVSPSRSPTETVIQMVPPVVEDVAVADILSTTSIPFTNIYTLAARLDICEDSKDFLFSKQPIEGVIFEEEREERSLDVDVLIPFEMMGTEPSLNPPIVITGCVHLIAIMQNQIVFNETVTIEFTTATRCKAGTWTPTGTNTPDLCEPCPLGTYGENLIGSSICLECPEDRPRTMTIGATSLGECQKCPLGMYCPVDSVPLLCPRSGFYEGPGDDLLDRNAEDCVKNKPCLDGWWCGEGAAEGSTYVQDLQSELVAVTSVIRQRKNGGWLVENLLESDNLVLRPKVDESTWFEFTEFTITNGTRIEALVTVDSAFFGEDVDKVNTTVIVEWYRESDPGNVFEFHVPVAITIVGIIVTPLTFETSILQETNELSPSIPTQIEIYNTLCNNSVSAIVSPLDCFNETYPDWFNLTEPDPFEPKEIAPQNGLPLTIPFALTNSPGLSSSRSIEDSIGKEAPFLKLCVPLELHLNGLGIIVLEKINISFRLLRPCPAGSFSISGMDERGCSLCSQNTYQNVPGSTFCETCPVNRPKTRFDGATDLSDCLTDKGGFLTLNNTREACPAGAVCEDIGITVETLKLLPGRWRTSPRSTKLLECPRSHYCRGGWMVQPQIMTNESSYALRNRGLQNEETLNEEALADNVCLTNHTGPFCFQCVAGTVKRSALRVCQGCTEEDYESDRFRIAVIFFILSLIFFLIIMGTYVFTYRSHLLTLGKAKKRMIEDRARDIYRALDFSTPIQITISFIQVVSGMSVTFRDVLPAFFVELRKIFSFLAFDLIAIIDFGCTLSAQNHFTSLLVSTLLPFGVSVLLFVLHMMIERRFAKTDRALRQLLRTTTFTSFLIINFLVYPSCSSTILATFSCRTLDDGRSVITTDPSITCQDSTYEQFRAYASFMVAVYPAGIPCLYAFLLFRERHQLNPYAGENKRFGRVAKAMRKNNKSIQYVHFLWGPYKPDYFWFELFELARKLAQTSIVVFISPGSSAQVVFQLMTTVICIVVVNSARPYAERLNNYLALLSQWSLFGIALATLLIKFNKLPSASSLGQQVFEQIGTEYDQNALDAFMIILFFCVPVAAMLLVIFKSFRAVRVICFCIDWEGVGKKFAKSSKPVTDLKKRISTRVKSARFSIARRASTSKPDDDDGGNLTVDPRAAESDNPVFETNDLERNTPNPMFNLRNDDDEDEENKKANKKKSGADQQAGDEEEGGKPPLTKPPSLMNMVRRTGQLLNQSRASFNMGETGTFFNKRPTNLEQALPQSKTKQMHRGSLVQLMEKVPANHEEAKDLIQKLKVHFELVKEDLLAELQQERTKKAMLISECDNLDDEKDALEVELDISKEEDLPDVRPLGAAGDIEGDPRKLENTASNRRLGITIDVINEVDSELEGSTGGSARPLSFRIKGESFQGSQNSIKRHDDPEEKQDYSSPASSRRVVTFSPDLGQGGGSLRSESSIFTQESSDDHELDEEAYQEEKKRKLMGRRTLLRKLKQQALEAEAAARADQQEGTDGDLPPPASNRQSFRSIRALARKKLEMQKKAEEEAAAEGKPIEHAVLKSLPSFRAALSSRPVSSDEEDGEAEEKASTPRAAPPLGQMNFSDKAPQPLSSVLHAVSHLSQQAGMDGYSSSNRSLLREGSLRSNSPLITSSGRNLKVETSPGGNPAPLVTALSGKFRLGGSDNDSPVGSRPSSGRFHRGSLEDGTNLVRSMRQVVGRIGGKVLGTAEQFTARPDIEEEVIPIGASKDDRIRIQSNRKDGTFDVKMSFEEAGQEGAPSISANANEDAQVSASPKKPAPLITALTNKFRLGASDNDSPNSTSNGSGRWHRSSVDESPTNSPSTNRVRSMRRVVGRIGGKVLGTPEQSPKPDIEEEVISIGTTKDDRIRIQSNRKDGTFDVKLSYEEAGPEGASVAQSTEPSAGPKKPTPLITAFSQKFRLGGSDNDSPSGAPRPSSGRWRRASLDESRMADGTNSPSTTNRVRSMRQAVERMLGTADQSPKPAVEEEVISIGASKDDRIRIQSNRKDGTFDVKMSYEEFGPDNGGSPALNEPSPVTASPKKPSPLVAGLPNRFKLASSDNDNSPKGSARGLDSSLSGRWNRGSVDSQTSKPGGSPSPVVRKDHGGRSRKGESGEGSPLTRAHSMRQVVGRIGSKILGSEQPVKKDVEEEVISLDMNTGERIRIKSNKRDGTFEAGFGAKSGDLDESEYTSD